MCSIIDYGFGRGPTGTIGNTPCNATTNETIYGVVNGSFDTSDIGNTYKGSVVFVNTIGTEIELTDPTTYTVTYAPAMHTFGVSLKSNMTVLGNYALRGSYIRYLSGSISCLDDISSSCVDLTLTQACTTPTCSFNII